MEQAVHTHSLFFIYYRKDVLRNPAGSNCGVLGGKASAVSLGRLAGDVK